MITHKKPHKPNHRRSKSSFAITFASYILGSIADHLSWGELTETMTLLFLVALIYGIYRRRKEKNIFASELEQYKKSELEFRRNTCNSVNKILSVCNDLLSRNLSNQRKCLLSVQSIEADIIALEAFWELCQTIGAKDSHVVISIHNEVLQDAKTVLEASRKLEKEIRDRIKQYQSMLSMYS